MENQQITVKLQKVGAGQFKIIATDQANNQIKSYIENDMQIIDALNEDQGMYDLTQWDATQIVISKAGF